MGPPSPSKAVPPTDALLDRSTPPGGEASTARRGGGGGWRAPLRLAPEAIARHASFPLAATGAAWPRLLPSRRT